MIVFWATEAMDHALAGFIGVFLFWALGVAEFDHAFSGFSNETTWFLLGAVLIGAMASKSGMAIIFLSNAHDVECSARSGFVHPNPMDFRNSCLF